jgi:hypothetical protein
MHFERNSLPEDLSHYWTVYLLLPYQLERNNNHFEMKSYTEDLSHYWTMPLLLP